MSNRMVGGLSNTIPYCYRQLEIMNKRRICSFSTCLSVGFMVLL